MGLFSDPAHDEDVVVLTERHDEDEHEEGQHEVDAGLAADDDEDEHGEAPALRDTTGRR